MGGALEPQVCNARSMDTHERLEASAAKFADGLVRLIEQRVQLALALERDRFDNQLADLTADVTTLANAVTTLTNIVQRLLEPPELHSVKVRDD